MHPCYPLAIKKIRLLFLWF